jgi:glycosyltransferase involved in cell wall biosynthesis
MKVTLVCIGRFHHFHLARQLERHGLLKEIVTGYPRFKLRDEFGIPSEKIASFPLFQGSYMFALSKGLNRLPKLKDSWAITAKRTLDHFASKRLQGVDIVVGLSGSATRTGRTIQAQGGKFVCDRGSSHIRYQNRILAEEHKRWGLTFRGIDPRFTSREEEEYNFADRITVPSDFVCRSFQESGIPADSLAKIPYGARLDRFSKVSEPDSKSFTVLWVGGVTVRKGFLDAFDAFRKLQHPAKQFRVIGSVEASVKRLLRGRDLSQVSFEGIVPNHELPRIYSSSHVFVLPSVEEGLAMVQGEALACGCPVIVSENTGGRDLFTPGVEGFEVPIRSPEQIAGHLQQLADDPALRRRMSDAALLRVQSIGGWDSYGDQFAQMLRQLHEQKVE